MRRAGAVLAGWAVLLAAPAISPENSHSAREKLERLERADAPSGTRVILTQDEINSYLRYDFAAEIPAGVTQPDVRLETDRVTGRALWTSPRGKRPVGALRECCWAGCCAASGR